MTAVRIITEEEVTAALTLSFAIDAVRAAFIGQSSGDVESPPRLDVAASGGSFRVMTAYLKKERVVAIKALIPLKPKVHLLLYDSDTGNLRAVIGADLIGQLRTAATTAVGTDVLARRDAKRLAVLGSGRQARRQVDAVAAVRELTDVFVYSRSAENRERFVDDIRKWFDGRVVGVSTAEEAVANADVVVTATTATEPILSRVRRGTHINAIGANTPQKKELSSDVLRSCDLLVVDSLQQAKAVAGDLIAAAGAGAFSWDNCRELGSLLVEHSTRTSDDQVTVFKSHGLVAGDAAIASALLRRLS